MPPVYKFRVKFEDYDEVTRDIEIKPNQTFKDLHDCIQQSINFDSSKPASFYMSNDQWLKLREISSVEKTTKDGKAIPTFENAVLNKFIIDPHQRIYYIFDTWTFFIELIKIQMIDDAKAKFPRCTKVNGEAPKQYKPTAPIPGTELGIDTADLDAEPLDEEIEDAVIETAEEGYEDDHGLESEEGEIPGDVVDEDSNPEIESDL